MRGLITIEYLKPLLRFRVFSYKKKNRKDETAMYEIRYLPSGARHLRMPNTRYVLVWRKDDLSDAYVGRIGGKRITDVTPEARKTGIYDYLMTIARTLL